MPRKPGRPRRELQNIDNKLAHLGGARTVLMGFDAQEMTNGEMASQLFTLTGVKVSHETVRKWIARWRQETPQEAAA